MTHRCPPSASHAASGHASLPEPTRRLGMVSTLGETVHYLGECPSLRADSSASSLRASLSGVLVRLTLLPRGVRQRLQTPTPLADRKSTRLNSSHMSISYA